MKKRLKYIGLCIAFLAVILFINGINPRQVDGNKSFSSGGRDDKATIAVDKEFVSNLPIVYIDTLGNEIDKTLAIRASISIADHGENSTSDAPDKQMYADIKFRGNSSYYTFDKKQYHIELKADIDGDDTIKKSILGMAEADDWVLNGPFLDRSLSRNYLGYKVARQLLRWAPDTRYCEVFLDGKYQGLYIMIEPITNEKDRLALSEYSLISGRTPYVLKTDRVGTEESAISTYGIQSGNYANEISIDYPVWKKLTDSQYLYILNDINTIQEVLYSDYFDNDDAGYSKYIDVDSFVDYYIISEFMMVTDAGNLSTYVYKDLNSKLHITTWDFNNSYNNIPWENKYYDRFYVAEANWFSRLLQDRKFVDAVVERYSQLRLDILSDDNLINMIDENIKYISDAANRNFEVWGYTFKYDLLSPDGDGNIRDPKSYEEAVSMLENEIKLRGRFLDENIEQLYDYCIN
ncbi:MAG: CotH kinase family protein [Eubacteriales bacterium]